MEKTEWTENVILADADYTDRVAFDLTVNFERMLGRRIPQADMAQWTECVALDGGLQEGCHEVQVILVHDRQARELKNFAPGKYEELNGKAFRGRLGEFTFTTVQTEEMAGKADLLSDMLQVIGHQEGVKRLMLIVADQQLDGLRPMLKRIDSDGRRTTVFTMQPSRSEHQTVVSDAGPSDSFAYGLGTMSYSLPSSASILHSSSYATR